MFGASETRAMKKPMSASAERTIFPAAAAAARPDDVEADGLPTPRRHVAMFAILTAIVLVVLDSAIANLALPTIAATLQIAPGDSVWVVTGYQVAIVMFLLPAGAAGEAFGYRRVFMAGVALFTLASACCALAPSLPWLVAARFLQGIGSAGVMALGVGIIRFIYPRRLLGAAIGWNALAVAFSGAAGPSIGAAILSVAAWPWLFAVNLPIGALVLILSCWLPATNATGRRIDIAGIGLNAAAFGGFFFGIDRAVAEPTIGIALLAAACIALAALVRREWARANPLIPLDLLRERSFRLSVMASVCCFTGQMAGLVAIPFYLQHELGQSAFVTGLYMTVWPLTVALAAPISGRLSDRMSTAWICAAGGTCLAAGLALIAFWPIPAWSIHGSLLPLVPFLVLSGFGFGLFQTPNNRNMLLSAPKERAGAAGGMQGMARLSGQTGGSVLMLVLFGLSTTEAAPHIGLAISAALAPAAGIISTLRGGTIISGR
jgi:DHA2 family multidrug resistance protein-like MFS transporter